MQWRFDEVATKVEERIGSLENIMKDLAYAQLRTEGSLRELSEEMKVFKDEMKVFKDETVAFKDEMLAFKDEMKVFKDEMLAFKDEMKNEVKRINKQWGDLANRLGTVAEDIVAPNIPRIARDYFNCEILEDFSIRRRIINKKDSTKVREFDVLVKCKNFVIVNDTKSTPKISYIDGFIRLLNELFDYFPEYKGLRMIPIFSSFSIPNDLLKYLTKNKIYAMAMKDDTMDLLNPELAL